MDYHELTTKAAKVIPSRFLLTKILSDRVKQLQSGAKPKVKFEEGTPLMEIALKEIADGKLELVGLEEAEIF